MRALLLSLSLALAGCVSVPSEAGFGDVKNLVDERQPGVELRWMRGTPEDAEVEDAIDRLLASPLTVEAAVQIALLNNRALQATYEDLGVAQADLVQAGLLKNPVFSLGAGFPSGGGRTKLDLDVASSFLDILFLPARKQLAGEAFEETKLRVADAVLGLAAETRSAWYQAVAARQVAQMRRLIADAAAIASETAKRLHDAGNINELALTSERSSHEQARTDLAKADEAAILARERLDKQLGLWGKRAAWTLPDRLPDVPAEEMSVDALESLAISRRLDLAAEVRLAKAMRASLGLTEKAPWLGSVDVGAAAERESDGGWLAGPELSLEVPIFDQGQARVAREQALWRRQERRVEALAADIRAEVRSRRDRVLLLRRRAEQQLKVAIPLRERAVALSQEQFNYMLIGVFELLETKRREYDAYQEYIEVVRDYWIVRTELIRALGA